MWHLYPLPRFSWRPPSQPKVTRWLTFLSVAQRLSLSSNVQAQVCGLQRNTQTDTDEQGVKVSYAGLLHFNISAQASQCLVYKYTDWQVDSECFIPRSRPLVPSWRASWWVLQRGVSCSLGVCPLTYGTKLLQHRWLREDGVRQVSQKATNYK